MFEFTTLTPDTNPEVFSRESDSRVSARYAHIDTDLILDAVKPSGWEPVVYKYSKRNVRGLAGGRSKSTVKHMNTSAKCKRCRYIGKNGRCSRVGRCKFA